MTSLMSNIKNPFLKDYSATSLLKKNYGVLLVNSQVKEQQQFLNHDFKNEYKHEKQNMSTSSSISNPFSKKTINAFDMLNQRRNPNQMQNSRVSSLSQNHHLLGSIEKNTLYKGLQDVGTKQMWKDELQKQARYQLKHFGPETLRYQYAPLQKYTSSYRSQQKSHSYTPTQNLALKQDHYQNSQQTPKWNKNITSEYYGYEESKQSKEDDDSFMIQRRTTKKSSLKKPVSGYSQKSRQQKQKHSYFENIPQDRNQDFQTVHTIKMKKAMQEQEFMRSSPSNISQSKRLSIENYQHSYQPESSASSGFGTPSEMYESGANFKTKFGNNKNGPLNTGTFDDEKEDDDQFGLDDFDDIKTKSYPESLEYNNKIYYKIPL